MKRHSTPSKTEAANPSGEAAELSEHETGKYEVSKEGAPPQWNRVQGKRGILKRLMEMPLDLLFEIFGQLDPPDLLHIARTTKALRAILMSRSSIFIWTQARSNIEGFPDCPDDLSEPQYAILAFGRSCSFCQLILSISHVAWSARVRCCNKCLDMHFMQVKNHSTWLNAADRGYPSLLARWAPCMTISRTSVSCKSGARNATVYALQSTDQLWRDEYTNIQDPNAKNEWMNCKLEERYAIEKHARECESRWSKGVQGAYRDEKKLLLAGRKATMITESVKKLGWEEELYKLPPVDYCAQYELLESFCPNDITETCLSNLTSCLDVFMKRNKAQRLFREHREFLESRRIVLHDIRKNGSKNLPINSVYPDIGELYRITEENPSLVDYSKSYPDALRVPFSDIALLWRKAIESKLLDLITDACSVEYEFDPNTVFDLATTFFNCTSCPGYTTTTPMGQAIPMGQTMLMRHERAMIHRCATVDGHYNSDDTPYELAFRDVLKGKSWNACVVEMCGFDPKVTTACEMDQANLIIECLSCNNIDKGRATMTWAVVRHHQRTSHDPDETDMVLKVLDEEEAVKVRERMKEEQVRQLHRDCNYKFMCPHCKSLAGNLPLLRTHLKNNHDITKVKEEELVYYLDQNLILLYIALASSR
ncbi:hypothetical protein BDZ97DRAFT_2074737 [Flammula alnicola]|nr:hypothetical protein BDZ97DRAFT_2074737 [Flammula alnicola]